MKIALFGGAFDPPHLGHQQVVTALVEEQIVDQVWLVPVGEHPFHKNLSADEHRLAMCQLAFDHVQTYELEKQGIGYSYDTLRHFQTQWPEHTFSWIIGSDNLPNFPQWKKYQQLLEEFAVYVYPRERFAMAPLLEGMVPLTEMPEVAIASTEVREKRKMGERVSGLVAPAVEEYIIKHKLYENS